MLAGEQDFPFPAAALDHIAGGGEKGGPFGGLERGPGRKGLCCGLDCQINLFWSCDRRPPDDFGFPGGVRMLVPLAGEDSFPSDDEAHLGEVVGRHVVSSQLMRSRSKVASPVTYQRTAVAGIVSAPVGSGCPACSALVLVSRWRSQSAHRAPFVWRRRSGSNHSSRDAASVAAASSSWHAPRRRSTDDEERRSWM